MGRDQGTGPSHMATPPRQSWWWDRDLMDDLLAQLPATAASYNIKKNGPVDSSHRKFAQEETLGEMGDKVML